jgi:putative pyoverdin transport system ATP-binding/permease protein
MSELLTILLRFGRRSTLVLAAVAGILSGLAGTAILALINRLMNLDDPLRGPRWLLWSFLALCVVLPLMRIGSAHLFNELGARAAQNLRLELSRQMLAAPLRQLEEVGTQSLLMALHRDIDILADLVTSIPTLSINLTLLVGCLAYMGWLSRPLLFMVLGLIAIGVVSYQVPIMLARRREGRVYDEHHRLYEHFAGLTSGMKELKMHAGRQAAFYSMLSATTDALRKAHLRARLVLVSINSWGGMLAFVAVGLLLFLASAFSVSTSREARSGFVLLLLFLSGPLELILNLAPGVARAGVAARRIKELGISLRRSHAERPAPANAEAGRWTSWELDRVTHTYRREHEDDCFLLGPVSLRFEPGRITFLVGGNGSGKTTLAKLMVGLYAPEDGEIRWNGEPVTDENRERYRQSFSVVFSDFYLFSRLFGLAEAPGSAARVQRWLAELDLASKVRFEDGELSTLDLSHGQRKRLALLTALLENRPIYLFDEWAADQDPHFKEVFYRRILPDLRERGRTVIVISHDDRYFDVADRVVKLDGGRVATDEVRYPLPRGADRVPA